MGKKIKISVLVSCFKTEEYLETFLEELPKQQDFDSIQVVLNLNEPTPQEAYWARLFKEKYPKNIKQIINNSVVPQSIAWNQCIREADGDLLAIWNVDDLRTSNSLKSQADAFKRNIVAVHGNFVIVRKFGSRLGQYIDHSYTLADTRELERSMCLGPFFMFRKSVVDEIGYFDEQLTVAADYDFAIRLAKHGGIGMASGVLGYFLDEQKGLSTCGDNIQPIERTMVEQRYGLTDKIDPQFISPMRRKGYDPDNLFLDGKKVEKVKYIEEDLREINGNRFYLHPKDENATLLRSICNYIRDGKEWEAWVLDTLRQYSNKKKVVIDVGASIGILTIPLAKWNKKVVAFEPEKTSFSLLQKNIELNKIKNVVVSDKGLGAEDKGVVLELGSGTINRSADGENIRVVRGDDELKKLGISLKSVGLIKIDAESYEDQVLLGLQEIIEKSKPYIYLETHENVSYAPDSREVAYNLMKQNNYKLIIGNNEKFGEFNGLWEYQEK